jgi:hypothetical protein
MSRYKVLIGATATAFALSVMPAWAQTPRGGGGSDRGGGGNRGGGAAASPRGDGGGGAATSGGGSGGSSVGGSSAASGGSSFSSPAISAPSARSRSEYTAPQRPRSSGAAKPRAGSDRGGSDRGSSDRGRAVPRASGSTTDGSRGTTRAPSANAAPDNDRVRANPATRAVPTHARPRNGEPLTGAAVRRQTPPVGPGNNIIIGYYPYYGYGQYYFPGYGFGLGYSFYDPLFYDPYAYGYSGGYGSGGYGYSRGGYRDTGSLRLKLKPRDAQVFVDGYYVGTVDEFDGMFQRLGIESGGHRIEVKADGYEPLQFEVLITPGETVTYKGEMKRDQIQ